MTIKYVAYNDKGEKLSGSLEVDTPEAAQEVLNRSDLTVVSLKKELHLNSIRLNIYQQFPSLFKPKIGEVASFNRELATLLESGISLIPAMKLIAEQVRNPLFKQSLLKIVNDIEMGVSFSEACSKHTTVFSNLHIRLMTIGEATGRLGPMLRQVAVHMEKRAATVSKVKKALTYPAFVLILGMIAVGIMVTVTLPSLTKLLDEVGGKLPLNARMLLSMSNFLESYGLYIISGFILALILSQWYIRTTVGKRKTDYLLIQMPVIKEAIINSNMAVFNRTLTTLLAAGIPLTEAIDLTINATDNIAVREALLKVREDLLTGSQLSQALSRQKVFPHLESQMITVGEQSGTLQKHMETLSNMYEEATDQSVNTLTGMIQPGVIIVVGGGIGFIMITLFQSIYSAVGQIK